VLDLTDEERRMRKLIAEDGEQVRTCLRQDENDLEPLRLTDEADFSVRRNSMTVSAENIRNQRRRKNPSSPW